MRAVLAGLVLAAAAAVAAAAISCSVTIESGVEAHHQTDQEESATPAATETPTELGHQEH
jgi:hypothetical protein